MYGNEDDDDDDADRVSATKYRKLKKLYLAAVEASPLSWRTGWPRADPDRVLTVRDSTEP